MPALNALAASGRAVPGLVAPLGGRLPIHDDALQAVASEPVKPMLDTVLLYLGTGTCVSGSDKGDRIFGGGVPAHGQRGNLPMQETVLAGLAEMVPALAKVKLLRHWAGIVDVTPDSSPIIGPSGLDGLYLNCGWGTGGFKSIPVGGWLLAHLMATGQHDPLSQPFDLTRFPTGRLIDEGAASGIAH